MTEDQETMHLKIFRAKAYGNGGNKDGKNVKRGTGKT